MVKTQKSNIKYSQKKIFGRTKNVELNKIKLKLSRKGTHVVKKRINNFVKDIANNKVSNDLVQKRNIYKNGKETMKEKVPMVAVTVQKLKEQKPFDDKQQMVKNKVPKSVKIQETKTIEITNIKRKDQDKNIKQEAKKASLTSKIEPTSFDEERFKDIFSLERIKKIVKALKDLVEKEVAEKKTSIFSDFRYFLNASSYKIPNCPKRMVKLNLKHSLVDTNMDDVVIIVPDLRRGAKVDYEPTIQHYEELFRENDVTGIKVVPFNQLRNECTTFEAKRKFANTYDYFLCDGRIVGHAVGFFGKSFQKSRSTLHAVHLSSPKTYKREIEHALKRTSFRQLQKGNLVSIPVGNHRFTKRQIADNIQLVINQLGTIFPGGYANIRNIYVRIDIKGTSSLPLYISLAGAPPETPNVVGPREQKMIKLKKQANDIISKFSISKKGDFMKLNKEQLEYRKQKLKAREILLSKGNVTVYNEEITDHFDNDVKNNESDQDGSNREDNSDDFENKDN